MLLFISRVICIERPFRLKVVVWTDHLGMHAYSLGVRLFFSVSTALNRTIQNLAARGQSIDDYNYENKEIGEIILEEIGDTKFDGISVSVERRTEKMG